MLARRLPPLLLLLTGPAVALGQASPAPALSPLESSAVARYSNASGSAGEMRSTARETSTMESVCSPES